jgi:protein SDA1
MQDHSDSDFDELAATAASQNVLRVGVRGRLMDSLPALQNAIKRDAESYKEEFRQQFNHFQAQLGIFKLQPARAPKQAKAFSDLITFVSHVAPCYPEHCKEFPTQLLELLDSHAATLDADLRRYAQHCKSFL